MQNRALKTLFFSLLTIPFATGAMASTVGVTPEIPARCPKLTEQSALFKSEEFNKATGSHEVEVVVDGMPFFLTKMGPFPSQDHNDRIEWKDRPVQTRCIYERFRGGTIEYLSFEEKEAALTRKANAGIVTEATNLTIEELKKLRSKFDTMKSLDFINITSLIWSGHKLYRSEIEALPAEKEALEKELTSFKTQFESNEAFKAITFPNYSTQLREVAYHKELIPEAVTKLREKFSHINSRDFVAILYNQYHEQQKGPNAAGIASGEQVHTYSAPEVIVESTPLKEQEPLIKASQDVRSKYQWPAEFLVVEAKRQYDPSFDPKKRSVTEAKQESK